MGDDMDKLDTALASVVTQLSELAANHGEQAVDLALWAYQVDAIRTVLIGVFFLIAGPALVTWLVPSLRAEISKGFMDSNAGIVVGCGFGVIAGGLAGLIAFIETANPALWLAAFGHPELMIATKALEAAGLL